jgi:3-phenylpropionate/cinnamic acid dioxygenase small subunit
MADKQLITQILGKLAWAYDSGNLQYFESVFAGDARFTLSIAGKGQVGDYRSLENIMSLYRGAQQSQTDQRRHVVSNVFFVEESDNTATVVSYLTLLATQAGLTRTLSSGVYTDRFELIDGEWRLRHRDLALDAPY